MEERARAPAARSRTTLSERFADVRSTSRALAAPLSAEDCAIQSMPDASPVKWHLAHTTCFFETFVLSRVDAARKPFHPAFRMLFNSYYNAIGERHPRPQRGLLSRPALDEVLAYRSEIEHEVSELLESNALAEDVRELIE